MIKTSPLSPERTAVVVNLSPKMPVLAAALLVFLAAFPLRALETNEWKFRQPLKVEQAGMIKLTQ